MPHKPSYNPVMSRREFLGFLKDLGYAGAAIVATPSILNAGEHRNASTLEARAASDKIKFSKETYFEGSESPKEENIGTYSGTVEELRQAYGTHIAPEIPIEFAQFNKTADKIAEKLRKDPLFLLRNARNITFSTLSKAKDGDRIFTAYNISYPFGLESEPLPELGDNVRLQNSNAVFLDIEAIVSKSPSGTVLKVVGLPSYRFEGSTYELRTPELRKPKSLVTDQLPHYHRSGYVVDGLQDEDSFLRTNDYIRYPQLKMGRESDPSSEEWSIATTKSGSSLMAKLDLSGVRRKLSEAIVNQILHYDEKWKPVFKR